MASTKRISMQQEPGGNMRPFDAFERICLEVVEIEAITNAASTAIDECPPPAESRREFDRTHALIGIAAQKAAQAVALIEELKSFVAERNASQ